MARHVGRRRYTVGTMRRLVIIFLALLLAAVVFVAGFAAWAIHDESFLKDRLVRLVEEQTGRVLTISGPLTLDLGRRTTLSANEIRFANAAWADRPDMVRIGQLRVSIELPALWGRVVHLPEIELADCVADLRRNDDGVANWDVLQTPEPSEPVAAKPWSLRLDRLQIDRCQLGLDGPQRPRPTNIRFDEVRLHREGDQRAEGWVDGFLDDEALSVRGWVEPPRAFGTGEPVALELEVQTHVATLDVSGGFEDGANLAGPDLDGRLQGPNIGVLLEQFARPRVSEGPFDLTFSLAARGESVLVELDGAFGDLDMRGSAELDKLVNPGRGHIENRISGPSLTAIGRVLGIDAALGDDFDEVLKQKVSVFRVVLHQLA